MAYYFKCFLNSLKVHFFGRFLFPTYNLQLLILFQYYIKYRMQCFHLISTHQEVGLKTMGQQLSFLMPTYWVSDETPCRGFEIASQIIHYRNSLYLAMIIDYRSTFVLLSCLLESKGVQFTAAKMLLIKLKGVAYQQSPLIA